MQLHPREQFTIVRQIEDHTDSNTYYVQAVVRNAKTDAVIDTVNLVARGGQRYSQNWLVPVDGSGQGFYISILTTVYEDSGHTSKSALYGEKIDIYLVQERMNVNFSGGGGGSDIDYKKVRKIIQEELEKLPPYPETPKTITKTEIVTKEIVKEVKVPHIVEKVVVKEVNVPQIVEKIKEVDRVVEVESSVDLNPIQKQLKSLLDKVEVVISSNKEYSDVKGILIAAGKIAKNEKRVDSRIKKFL